MSDNKVLSSIQALGKEIIPLGEHLYLYGSRVRSDHRPNSDWDLLILLDKDKEEYSDFDDYSYPFIELGYDLDATISAHLYTINKWKKMSFSVFYHNVERDKIVLV